jgi:hypothetical protein
MAGRTTTGWAVENVSYGIGLRFHFVFGAGLCGLLFWRHGELDVKITEGGGFGIVVLIPARN